MKKTDLSMIFFIAVVSIVASFFIAKSIVGDVYKGTATVKTIDKIDAVIVEPSSEIFNENAINPSVQVEIDSPASSGTQ